MKTAIYPGSFDPITLGHLNIIKRASGCFDKLIVCVMVNSEKRESGLFTPDERVDMIRRVVGKLPNVEVDQSELLVSEYAREKRACASLCWGSWPVRRCWALPVPCTPGCTGRG